MKNVIYQIVNLVNGKRYIGSARNFNNRQPNHINMLRGNRHYNVHLQNSYNLYGEEVFEFEIIDSVRHKEELQYREDYWIDKYDFDKELYNRCRYAYSTIGRPVSEETREKIRQGNIGKTIPEYQIRKTQETILELYGGAPNRKKVVQIDPVTGKFIKIYPSVKLAGEAVGIFPSGISTVANNSSYYSTRSKKWYKRTTAGGYRWKFI